MGGNAERRGEKKKGDMCRGDMCQGDSMQHWLDWESQQHHRDRMRCDEDEEGRLLK